MMNFLKDVPQVDAKSTYERWQRGEVALLDVREQQEWNLGHIEGIDFIPLGQLQRRLSELDPEQEVVVVCRSGNRSNYAAAFLRQMGMSAANLAGGMLDWKAKGLPITPPGIIESH